MKRTIGLFTVLLFTTFFASFVFAASVYTDKTDYTPGETVYISGYGFSSNSVVNIRILRPDGVTDVCPMVGRCGSLYVTDGTGSFSNYAYVLDGITGTYTVTATDGINSAQITFTDTSTTTTLNSISTPLTAGQTSVSYSGMVTGGVPDGRTVELRYGSTCTQGNSGSLIASTTTSSGSFSSTFTAPSAGSYHFWAFFPSGGGGGLEHPARVVNQ